MGVKLGLSGVKRVVTLMKPLNNNMETIFTKDNKELKRLSESNTQTNHLSRDGFDEPTDSSDDPHKQF
jgi:hypothetical protein